ncbi:MAG: hypothetical protein ABJN40_20145 [Sneathiella sp.]
MDAQEKLNELIDLLSGFIAGTYSADVLQDFVWEVIDFYSSTPKELLPPVLSDEKVFWCAVWQIQHLATEDHISDGSATASLTDALMYLRGEEEMPKEFFGARP